MRHAETARCRPAIVAAILVSCLVPAVAAQTSGNPADSDRLCRRVFDAIDAPEIGFGLQSHELRPSSHAALDRIINFTRNCPGYTIIVIGHSDALGDEAFNIEISRRRAQSVADYLQRGGVDAARLRVEGRGSSEPVADNATRSGRAKNRRIELRLAAPGAGE